MKPLKVNFFGSFWWVKTIVLDPTEGLYFNQIAAKIKIQDLHPSQILFPVFKTVENANKIPEFSGLHIKFIETGKISKTMMIENDFLPELLTFELFNHQEHLFFGDVFYGDKKLKNRKSDTLLNRAVGKIN